MKLLTVDELRAILEEQKEIFQSEMLYGSGRFLTATEKANKQSSYLKGIIIGWLEIDYIDGPTFDRLCCDYNLLGYSKK